MDRIIDTISMTDDKPNSTKSLALIRLLVTIIMLMLIAIIIIMVQNNQLYQLLGLERH